MNKLTTSGPMMINFKTGRLMPIESGDYPIGTVVSYGDMANPRTRYVITGPAEEYGQPCVSERGGKSQVSKSAIEGPGGWRLENCPRMTEADLAAFLESAQGTRARLDQEATEKAAKEATEEAQAIARLRKEYPKLELAEGSKKSCQALAAANIRKLLKAKFPACKFSVRSESFSMGNAVRVSWTDGPTTKDVEEITGNFVSSGFDSMQDLSYNVKSPWHIFGDSKYVTTSREISDCNRIAVCAEVIAEYGIDRTPEELAEDARMGRLWGEDDWIARKLRDAYSSRSF